MTLNTLIHRLSAIADMTNIGDFEVTWDGHADLDKLWVIQDGEKKEISFTYQD